MNEQTILTAIRLAQVLEGESDTQPAQPLMVPVTPEWVIVRGDRSGVFFGLMTARSGQSVELEDARHIWYWAGAANTAEIASSGVSKPAECKILGPVARVLVLDAVSVLTCTEAACVSLDAVPAWSKR